jgi:MoaA/NifB/PqqE/SkfB family radical SAM enzyme
MERLAKIDAAFRFAGVMLRRGRMPIVVRWQTTNRCTAKCLYCEIWKNPGPELSTAEAWSMIGGFYALGMRRLCFSGGEPLLRGDIDELMGLCRERGISAEMNTNGVLLEGHLAGLRHLSLVKVSIDGPRELHDGIRHSPMYDAIVENLEAARASGVRFSLTTTLTRDNTSTATVDHVLGLAERFDTFAAFQPVVSTTPWGRGDMESIAPTPERMREVVLHLMSVKERRPARIRNSMAGLRRILGWPRFPKAECTAGIIFAVVESNGDLYACERTPYPPGTSFPNVRDGVRQAFERIVFPDCPGCGFCGATELNLLWNRDISAWREVGRIVGLVRG